MKRSEALKRTRESMLSHDDSRKLFTAIHTASGNGYLGTKLEYLSLEELTHADKHFLYVQWRPRYQDE